MEGVKPPPPVRLKDYSVTLAPSRPSLVVVRSSPIVREDFATREEELKARESRRSRWSRPPWRRWAATGAWGSSSPRRRGRDQAQRPFDKIPTWPPRPARHAGRRGQALLGAGARKVIVADNPIKPESCFFKTKVARPLYARAPS